MSENPLQLRAAYGVCRHIARSAAKNFYYGFLVLPKPKRNAISAVYAFMRQADDISDDPAIPVEQRREKLKEWMDSLRRVVEGERTDNPVLMALADSQKTFNIPLDLLEKLVQGTAMDVPSGAAVTSESAAGPQGEASAAERKHKIGAANAQSEKGVTQQDLPADALPPTQLQYDTFAQLYDYCYHVASVVGLVCIRIFGYRDARAEKLAEETGVAFQLTNIVRDVKEDAQLGRVYLPREDLERFGLKASSLANGAGPASFRPVLEFEVQRARKFYESAQELLPLVDDDSQPALWTLVEIYRRLLEKIAARDYDVFSQRVRLGTAEKIAVLGKGFLRRLT